ncbi:unnamed protein product [Closterium sp. NIES-65]|nr:unnamed protein product [Closterium sp. NIES-65]
MAITIALTCALPLPSRARPGCRRRVRARLDRGRRARTACPPPSLSPPPVLSFPRPPSLPPLFPGIFLSLRGVPNPSSPTPLLLPPSHHLLPLRSSHPPLTLLPLSSLLPTLHPPPPSFPSPSHSLLLLSPLVYCCSRLPALLRSLAHQELPLLTICPFTLLLLSSLPLFPSPSHSLLCLSLLSSTAAAGCRPCFVVVLLPHSVPPPLFSPLSGAAAHYSTVIPPPLISPLSGAATDYSAIIPPPLISSLSGAKADYSAIIPPLISPLSSAAADYSAIIPPPLISPLSDTASAIYSTL